MLGVGVLNVKLACMSSCLYA